MLDDLALWTTGDSFMFVEKVDAGPSIIWSYDCKKTSFGDKEINRNENLCRLGHIPYVDEYGQSKNRLEGEMNTSNLHQHPNLGAILWMSREIGKIYHPIECCSYREWREMFLGLILFSWENLDAHPVCPL